MGPSILRAGRARLQEFDSMAACPDVKVRRALALAAVLALAPAPAALATEAPAAGTTIVVTLDQAKVIRLPPKTATLIIGNPMIADVTMLKTAGSMVVTGKGFGETNMIALDSNGNLVAESFIRVRSPNSVLVVQRGAERESYSCSPQCQPTVQLGDGKLFTEASTQIQARNGLIQPGLTPR
jgi:Flp pilus assembly secretin CpaC